MSLGFDLSVNNYTIEDLLTLLGLGSNPTIPEVNNKLNIFIDMFRGISGESSGEIINFFQDVGERLNEDFFEATEFQPENLFNYVEPHMMDNAISVTRPFPHMLDMDNGISPEDLIVCRDVDRDEQQQVSTREDGTFITKIVGTTKQKFYNYEFSVENLDVVTQLNERTIFKYTFNELLTDVKELYLSKIVVPMPYTISSYKMNNRFTIHDVSNNDTKTIIIDDSYFIHYTDIQSLITYLNNEYFLNTDNSNNILGNITLSLLSKPSNRFALKFDLSNNPAFSTFTLSFDVSNQYACFDPVYQLNKILGFNELVYPNQTSIPGGTIFLTQPKLYFTLDDHQINYNQNLRTQGNSSGISNLLGTVYLNAADLAANDHILYNTFTTNEVTQNSRIYNGPVNLDTFTVRFYDVNKILQQIPSEGFDGNCFYFTLLKKNISSGY